MASHSFDTASAPRPCAPSPAAEPDLIIVEPCADGHYIHQQTIKFLKTFYKRKDDFKPENMSSYLDMFHPKGVTEYLQTGEDVKVRNFHREAIEKTRLTYHEKWAAQRHYDISYTMPRDLKLIQKTREARVNVYGRYTTQSWDGVQHDGRFQAVVCVGWEGKWFRRWGRKRIVAVKDEICTWTVETIAEPLPLEEILAPLPVPTRIHSITSLISYGDRVSIVRSSVA